MPIYEFICECKRKKEAILPFSEADKPQVCKCGNVMQRKMSVPHFVMKQTGRGMALDTLNSNVVGGGRKEWAENIAAQGL